MSWKPRGNIERMKIKNRGKGKGFRPERDKMIRGHEKGFRSKGFRIPKKKSRHERDEV